MKFKANTGSLLFNSKPDEESAEQAPEMSLYDELIAFSSLSLEEQEKQASQARAPIPSAPLANEPAQPPSPVSAERAFEQASDASHPAASASLSDDASGFDFQQARATGERAYEQLKEIAFELMNREAPEKGSVVERAISPAAKSVRKNTSELAREAALSRASDSRFADDFSFDSQGLDVFKITGPLPVTGTRTGAATSLTVCASCGNEADSDEMFCITCGELLVEAQAASVEVVEDMVCEDCGAVVAGEDIFCPSCGSVMSGA